ncbi:MAG: Uma2 family endonuclease [Candidatus Latescibacteria bacterium]|nr:Uma2 family endonuclease [Candidatus Latescibacterota bacterium]
METKTLLTADDLLRTEHPGPCELAKGELIRMAPTGYGHGRLTVRIAVLLEQFVRPRDLGEVLGAETGFIVFRDPDTVRAPDVMFVSKERLSGEIDPDHFLPFAPDLAVEVVSPSNLWSEIEEKVEEYLEAGVRMIWIVNPRTRSITVYRSRSQVQILGSEDTLAGEDVLPGFNASVAEIFA